MKPRSPAEPMHLEGLPLFPPDNGTPTSQTAAQKVAPYTPTQRQRIVEAIRTHGPMTRLEISQVTGIKENAVNGRCSAGELCHPLHPQLQHVGERDGREVLGLADGV